MTDYAKGFYLSWYQRAIDFPELAAIWDAGYRYVHIRASSGLRPDKTFDRHWDNAGQLGFLRSAWHYLSPDEWGQAALFKQIIGNRVPELGFYGDFEARGLTPEKCNMFLNAVDNHFGCICNIYTAAWWLNPRGRPPWQKQGRKLWVCDVVNRDNPKLPVAFTTWEFHQIGLTRDVPFPCTVGLDKFNGTIAKLYNKYGSHP